MLTDGWEFFIINPLINNFKEKNQELYQEEYNRCYKNLIESICIPDPNEIVNDEFNLLLNCEGENDIINLDSEYEYKFLKSKFLEKRFSKIKKEIDYYYSKYNIIVKIFKNDNNYIIILNRTSHI
tara:strand:- start:168 stop:542 length:375 start_codon:yes stop_codon:yes gene_type:complete